MQTALQRECALPARPAATVEELQQRCPDLVFLLDATERPIQRPQDDGRQRRHYSGKKKRHTVKNTVVSNARGTQVAFLGAPAAGSRHDKTQAEADAPPFPSGSHGAGDLGYQGLDPPNLVLTRPIKTPRGGQLTEDERACNRRVAQLRIYVEHAIRGIKIHRVTADVLRATKTGFADLVIEVATGLFNWQNCRRSYASVVGS
ncbi:MAG: transposase family protein [Armatimonadota bacterium]